jgi:hypothetical protein
MMPQHAARRRFATRVADAAGRGMNRDRRANVEAAIRKLKDDGGH